jgi:hypothetical protein
MYFLKTNNSSYAHKNEGSNLGNVHLEKRLMFQYTVPAAFWRLISPEGVSHMTVQKVVKGSQLMEWKQTLLLLAHSTFSYPLRSILPIKISSSHIPRPTIHALRFLYRRSAPVFQNKFNFKDTFKLELQEEEYVYFLIQEIYWNKWFTVTA